MGRTAAIAAASGVAALALLGAAFHYAWQEGLIPTSLVGAHPRAPLPENFLATLKQDPLVAQSLPQGCVSMHLHTGREIDSMGRPGLAYQRLPGWDVIVIAQVPGDGGQRIGNLTEALEVLAKAGVYSARDTETDDGMGGKLPARSYALTMSGWKSLLDEQCFQAGHPRVTAVSEYSRVMPDKNGKRVYEITAQYANQDIPPWTNQPSVQAFVSQDQLKRLREPGTARFRLLRIDTGWEVERAPHAAPELTPQTVMALVTKANGGAVPQACIRLPASGAAPGFDVTLAPYAATLYDTDAQSPVDGRFLTELMWVGRLSQLVRAGIFTEQKVGANPALNTPAGTRFVLDPSYQKWLDMNDGRCLRMGQAALEFVGASIPRQMKREDSSQNDATATARFVLRLSKDAWIEKVAVSLPEVEAVKEVGGVPVVARLAWTGRDKEEQWRLASLQAAQSEPVPPRRSRVNLPPAPSATAAPAPAPRVTGSAPGGDVTWRTTVGSTVNGRVSNEGLTVTYCCSGASSATPASRGVSSGKLYAEFTMTARPRALKADTWTTIGVLPVTGSGNDGGMFLAAPSTPAMYPQREHEIAHTDVIGIALDMDARQLYFSRNGAWINGQPGSGGGVPLRRGQDYSIVAETSASSGGGTDSWTANFGKTRFRHAIPKGFKSYDGRQRG